MLEIPNKHRDSGKRKTSYVWNTLLAIASVVTTVVIAGPAAAHEPLWGEAASTVGDRVIHPDIRFQFDPSHRLMNGTAVIPNPTGLRMSRWEERTTIDYGIGPKWNIRAEIPVMRLDMQQTVGGVPVSGKYFSQGDMVLAGKHRFGLKVKKGFKDQQSIQLGLKVPTGPTSFRDSTGALLPPDMQPGSGTVGMTLGLAATRETTKNTIWVSSFWDHSFSRRRFTPGDNVVVDGSYGHWLKFPESLPDLGTLLAMGLRAEWQSRDRVQGARDPNSGGSMFALHTTFVAQQNQYQFRVGALFPIAQGVNGVHAVERFQIRFGIERFF